MLCTPIRLFFEIDVDNMSPCHDQLVKIVKMTSLNAIWVCSTDTVKQMVNNEGKTLSNQPVSTLQELQLG